MSYNFVRILETTITVYVFLHLNMINKVQTRTHLKGLHDSCNSFHCTCDHEYLKISCIRCCFRVAIIDSPKDTPAIYADSSIRIQRTEAWYILVSESFAQQTIEGLKSNQSLIPAIRYCTVAINLRHNYVPDKWLWTPESALVAAVILLEITRVFVY